MRARSRKRDSMQKHWLTWILFSTVACSGTAPDQAGANEAAVVAPDAGKAAACGGDKGEGGKGEGGKGEGEGGKGEGKDPKPSDSTCDEQRKKLVEALTTETDLELLARLKKEYIELEERCPAGPDPTAGDCKLGLADAEKYLALAIESGDGKAIAEAKEKYAIAEKECQSGGSDPCKGAEPGKPGEPDKDGADKDDGRVPAKGKGDDEGWHPCKVPDKGDGSPEPPVK